MYNNAVVLKLVNAKDPQIDTYQPADPHLKRYARDPHKRRFFFTALAVILNHFNFKDPQFDMHQGYGPPFNGISITWTAIYIVKSMSI